MEIVGVIAGRAVYVAVRDGRQVIRMRYGQVGMGMMHLLGSPDVIRIDDQPWLEIEHTAEVDQRLVELVDVAAGIRNDHPRMVQLSMFSAETADLHA